MADDLQAPAHAIRAINWREAFSFTNLFRTFRIAIHPSKLVLALVALLLMYIGGRFLDEVWRVGDRAVPGEIVAYEKYQQSSAPNRSFADLRKAARGDVEDFYARLLLQYKVVTDPKAAADAAKNIQLLGDLKGKIINERNTKKDTVEKDKFNALALAEKIPDGRQRRDAKETIEQQSRDAIRSAFSEATANYELAKGVKNQGLFEHFFNFELFQVTAVVQGVREWNWLQEGGVLHAVQRFFTTGPLWLLSQHSLYFILFGTWFLSLWAIFGGAVCRIAAVHVARDEKMSIRQALKFSVNKFLSFLFAPIIPLLIILVVGLVLAAGALLGNIPFFGPIIVGVFFFLALAAGFVMSLVLLGLVGGVNLMYPTIAVEGSDSFDAISRSFSYLYARPWRLGFYTLVAVIYGAMTYLFVRLFIFLMLALAHKFVGAGIFVHADNTANLWPMMWPDPATGERLSYQPDHLTLGAGQDVGATLVAVWVYLTIAMLGAFAISFYFSANTIIYYLLRREVDATEMDDVYLEQVDDEFAETPTSAAEATAPGSTPAAPSDATPPT